MSTLSVRLPNSLHNGIKKFSKEEGISMNQFIASAVAEKMSALKTIEYLEERGKQGNKEAYLNVLGKVPNRDPLDFDRLDP